MFEAHTVKGRVETLVLTPAAREYVVHIAVTGLWTELGVGHHRMDHRLHVEIREWDWPGRWG